MNDDIQADELLLELLKIERLEEKNRPRSKDDIVAAMARWGSGGIYATFDYAVNNGLLKQVKREYWMFPKQDYWVMTAKFQSDDYPPTKEQIPNTVNV